MTTTTQVGQIAIVSGDHEWNGRRVLITSVEYGYLGGIYRYQVELPEQQSLPYTKRLVARVDPDMICVLSENEQLQTTNQLPIGFETFHQLLTR